MSETQIILILEVLFLIFCIGSEIFTIKSYMESKNRVDYVLIVFSTIITIQSIFFIAMIIDLVSGFTIGVFLNLNNIIFLGFICLEIEFLLYIKGLKKLYPLPIVITLYIGSGLILIKNDLPLFIFAISSGIIVFFILTIEGYRNRNGLALSIAIFALFNVSAQLIESLFHGSAIIISILRLIAIFIMLLGTSGFIDKYVIIDIEEEKNMMKIWISKVVIGENK